MSDTCACQSGPVLAHVVEPGWEWADIISDPGRCGFRLLNYPDGTVRFEHRCDRGERGVIVCAPALQIGGGHSITRAGEGTRNHPNGKPTVSPSILCSDCSVHGFVVDGVWRSA